MTGIPLANGDTLTVTTALDDGTGTYPIDVSSLVMLNRGVSVSSYGRGDEFSQAQPATLALTLDNTDSSVTNGSGFATLPFNTGPFGGGTPITPGQGVRVTYTVGATTRNRFTGRISAAGLVWPNGGQEQAEVAITANDRLADLGRRTMRSLLEEEILSHPPDAYYTLGEAEGATSAGDSSGKQAPPLVVADAGSAVVFGNGTGPVDGLTAAQLTGGQSLNDGNTTWAPQSLTGGVGLCFATSTTPVGFNVTLAVHRGWTLQVNTSGQLEGWIPGFIITGPSVVDGQTHRADLWGDGTTSTLVLDGAAVGSLSLSVLGTSAYTGLSVGNTFGGQRAGFTTATATVSHVTTWTSLNTSAAIAIGQATSGFVGDTAAQRLARIATYAGVTSSTTTGMSGQVMGTQATSGSSAFDALQAVAAAEGGVLYANGSGTIVLQGRNYRAQKITADLTLDSDEVSGDTAVTYDTQQLVNQATATRTDGAAQVVQDATSIATNGLFPTSLDLAVATDSDALAAAQWVVARHKNPSIRLGSAAFTPLTSASPQQILARDVGDRLALTPMPSQMWAGAGDVILEGWSESVSQDSWQLTANLLPWSLFTAFVLDSATLGVLDGSTPIGF